MHRGHVEKEKSDEPPVDYPPHNGEAPLYSKEAWLPFSQEKGFLSDQSPPYPLDQDTHPTLREALSLLVSLLQTFPEQIAISDLEPSENDNRFYCE